MKALSPLFVATVIFLCHPLSAEDFDPVRMGVVPGVTGDQIALEGGYAYVAGTPFRVINVHNPAHPVIVGTLNIRSYRVTVQSPYAYAVTSDLGLVIIDIHDPANPSVVGSYANAFGDVVILKGYAFVCAEGIQRVNISDPAHPYGDGAYQINKLPASLATDGRFLYVADLRAGLIVIDPVDFSHHVSMTATGYSSGPEYVAIAGARAYVSTWGVTTTLDISNPAVPNKLGGLSLVTDAGGPVLAFGNRLLNAQRSYGLVTYDVDASGNLSACGRFFDPTQRIISLATDGRYAYCATYPLAGAPPQFEIIDLFRPANPQRKNPTPESIYGGGAIWPIGSCIYESTGRGWRVFDASTSPPTDLGFNTNLDGKFSIVAADQRYAYATGYNADRGGLSILDISDPRTPFLTRDYRDPRDPGPTSERINLTGYGKMQVADKRLYLAFRPMPATATYGTPLLQIYDISDAVNPALLGETQIADLSDRLIVRGGFAYIPNSELGLQIVNIADPVHPVALPPLQVAGASDLAVISRFGLLCAGVQGLYLLDFQDPSKPQIVKSISLHGPAAFRIWIAGSLAYVTGSGINVFDITDPLAIKRVGGNSVVIDASIVSIPSHLFFAGLYQSLQEFDAFHPNQPAIRLHFIPAFGSDPTHILLNSSGSTLGRIQRANALGDWVDWMPATADEEPVDFPDSSAPGSQSFYRFISP